MAREGKQIMRRGRR